MVAPRVVVAICRSLVGYLSLVADPRSLQLGTAAGSIEGGTLASRRWAWDPASDPVLEPPPDYPRS